MLHEIFKAQLPGAPQPRQERNKATIIADDGSTWAAMQANQEGSGVMKIHLCCVCEMFAVWTVG